MRLRQEARLAGGAWLAFSTATALLIWLATGGASRLSAQEPAPEAAPAAAEAPADPAAAPAATAEEPAQAEGAAPTPGEEATAPPAPENMLQWAIRASGPIGVFLVFLSVYFTALVIRLFIEYRVTEAVPPPLVEKLEAAIRDKKFQEAYDLCRDNDSFLARLVRTGIANLPNGRAEAKEAMAVTSAEIVTELEMKISYLATIGTLGPMIGLVGTVWGMIESFREIATAAGAQPRPDKVAAGISTALFITLEGVSLSVPAIFFFAFFRNRVAAMSIEANRVADRTITSLVTAAKTASKPSA
ncbi:MotA/TolQ/ExbB proton channel family protein [Planctomyces sp. SH-PL62]|uniref:MotA/TolQ/ExbB proton channel family protein n=1 Tax=Planctomyces sp. SH-PL62 TaxID=1636152 RepID=UPI00078B7DA2|nr:MotA/TolQ/ExbB proton channel family protein [Planctomyces sp. SH-PL62]AMV39884.1 Biopolymer transport protein ExbB [Planctomyces sp. SH-PL62]